MPIDIALVKSTPRSVSGSTSDSSPVHVPQDLNSDTEAPTGTKKEDLMFQRTQELCGLLVGYAFALQYVTRPLGCPATIECVLIQGTIYMGHVHYLNHPSRTSFRQLTSLLYAVPRRGSDSPNLMRLHLPPSPRRR